MNRNKRPAVGRATAEQIQRRDFLAAAGSAAALAGLSPLWAVAKDTAPASAAAKIAIPVATQNSQSEVGKGPRDEGTEGEAEVRAGACARCATPISIP